MVQLDETLQEFSLASWRRRIGYVPQESPLMAGTIRENRADGLDREPSDEELIEAARSVSADEFMQGLPNGYDTEVGERGVKLSGGQRQRVPRERPAQQLRPLHSRHLRLHRGGAA